MENLTLQEALRQLNEIVFEINKYNAMVPLDYRRNTKCMTQEEALKLRILQQKRIQLEKVVDKLSIEFE